MISGTTKRQQVRNEKALQDLVRSTPGNNVCADCGIANPSWASWSVRSPGPSPLCQPAPPSLSMGEEPRCRR